MIFHQIASGGCQSYLIGCEETLSAALIDPELGQIDRYRALVAHEGLHLRYVIDTHTHADHFSATKALAAAFDIPVVMSRAGAAPHTGLRLDDGDMLLVGKLKLQAMHTPGHTADSMCLVMTDRVFTGDTLLIGGTGRTDLPSGDPDQLFDSLFDKLLTLPPELLVYPAHDYKGRSYSTLATEISDNPRLQKTDRRAFTAMMRELNLAAPTHLTEALRTNVSGGKTVAQLLADAGAGVPFVAQAELARRLENRQNDLVVLDVREESAFAAGHIPGAINLPRGQLELRINAAFPDPSVRIVTVCEFGKISILAAATLREVGFLRTAALEGGMAVWRENGLPGEMP